MDLSCHRKRLSSSHGTQPGWNLPRGWSRQRGYRFNPGDHRDAIEKRRWTNRSGARAFSCRREVSAGFLAAGEHWAGGLRAAAMLRLRIPMPDLERVSAFSRVVHLASQRSVHEAFQWLHLQEPRIMDWQAEMVEIAAPPFHERDRAVRLSERFRDLGLEAVEID